MIPVDPEKVENWLGTNWRGSDAKKCPICKSNNWIISPNVMELNEHRTDPSERIRYNPLFLITCSTCGNTLVFNAIQSGVAPRNETTQTPRAAPFAEPNEEGGR